MPKIEEFTAQGTFQPSEAGITAAREAASVESRMGRIAGAALGGAISRTGGIVGRAIDQHIAMTQISHGSAVYSSLFSDLTQKWNYAASHTDPNDTSVQQGFYEHTLDPALEKFTASFDDASPAAQQWAQQRAMEMRSHFTQKTTADMGIRAADAAQQNITSSVNNYSSTVLNDPTALSHSIDSFKADLKAQLDSNPYLDASSKARISNELEPQAIKTIAKTAAYSMAKANPDELTASVEAGHFDDYLNGNEKAGLLKFADQMKKANVADELRNLELQKRQQEIQQNKTMNGYVTDILSGKGDVTKRLASDATLTPQQRENLVNFQSEHLRQLRSNADNTPHPEVYRGLLNNLFDVARDNPENLSVTPIREAFTAGKLNPTEEASLEARFNAMNRPLERNFHTQILHVERAISQSPYLKYDAAKQAQTVNLIEADARHTLDQYRESGKDVRPLLDPTSSDYLFSPAKINAYLIPQNQSLSDQAKTVKSGIEYNGYRFPNQAALDKYKAAVAQQGGK